MGHDTRVDATKLQLFFEGEGLHDLNFSELQSGFEIGFTDSDLLDEPLFDALFELVGFVERQVSLGPNEDLIIFEL